MAGMIFSGVLYSAALLFGVIATTSLHWRQWRSGALFVVLMAVVGLALISLQRGALLPLIVFSVIAIAGIAPAVRWCKATDAARGTAGAG